MKIQTRITLPPEVRPAIDQVRLAWNPERATDNPAHLTVIYHDEAPDAALLVERLRHIVARMTPFPLVVGSAVRFPEPVQGAYLTVADHTGGIAALRASVLAPPFLSRTRFGLHITLLHPDQGTRLEAAWPTFVNLPTTGRFMVTELQLVDSANVTLETFPLAQPRQ